MSDDDSKKINNFFNYINSLISLVKVFSNRGRGFFLLSGVLLSISRVVQIAAFFMPIKVLIVMSSDNYPVYFDYVLEYISAGMIITLLSLSVPFFYLLYIFLGVVHRRVFDYDVLHQKREPLTFNNREYKGKSFVSLYQRTDKAFSELLLYCFSLFILLFAGFFIFVSVFLVSALIVVFIDRSTRAATEDTRLTLLRLHRRQFVEYFMSSGFLFVFLILVFSIKLTNISIISALLALLVSRMLFQAVQRFFTETFHLRKLLV